MEALDLERVVARCDEAGAPARRNVENALIRGRFKALDEHWLGAVSGRLDLERALCVLGLTGEIPLDVEVPKVLDGLAEEVGSRLSGDRAFDAGLGALREVLHGGHNLRGNAADYESPENSYLGHVLTSGKGIPISLCTVAILVARRLELPVFGIGSPGHFLGFYGDVHLRIGSFFDPFDGFRRLNAGELRALMAQFVEKLEPYMLAPVPDREILARFLRNLTGSYTKANQSEHIRNLQRWNQSLNP